jgi:hypothetical protein
MKNPDAWPRWPALPVVKRNAQMSDPEACGFLMAPGLKNGPPVPEVYIGNIITLSVDRVPLAKIPKKTYLDLEALVAEWRVD